jgi:hypothetical protein
MGRIKLDQVRDRSVHVKLRQRHWDKALQLAEEKPTANVCMRCPVALAINDALKRKFRRHKRVYSSVDGAGTLIYEIGTDDRHVGHVGFRVAKLAVPRVGRSWVNAFDTRPRPTCPAPADFVVELEKTVTIG